MATINGGAYAATVDLSLIQKTGLQMERERDWAKLTQDILPILHRVSEAEKPEALRAAQLDSLELLFERLMEMGWADIDLTLDHSAGCIWANTEPRRPLFMQSFADKLVRDRFAGYRSKLPSDMRIHYLPIERVGALATVDLDAMATYSSDHDSDCIAISFGLMKLRFWERAVWEATSASATVEDREAMCVMAYDLLGCTIAPDTIAALVVNEPPEISSSNASVIMECFVTMHEIGHYELGHRSIVTDSARLDAETSRYLEAQADRFALDHLRRMTPNMDAIAGALALLFMLFALAPDCVTAYPSCDDSSTHPHPLRRLVWLLRELYPDDAHGALRYLSFAVQHIMLATQTKGEYEASVLSDAVYLTIASTAPPPSAFDAT